MFNSSLLIKTSIELNDGKYSSEDPLVKACRDFFLDVIRTEIEMWQDQGGTDKDFIDRFDVVFPKGFIRRDIERAKNVIFDLYDIAISPVLRFDLSPINNFVMYGLIEGWFLAWEGNKEMLCVLRGLKTYLRKKKVSGRDAEIILDWFTDNHVCLNDFVETYNGDYISERFAEEVAGMYLSEGANAFGLRVLRVTIDEFFDLLPNDLRDLCIQKYERENQNMGKGYLVEKKINQPPTVFVSYSWDNEQHKRWVKSLADKLVENSIQVILDQNDLVLGDPLPHFMEQSIMGSDYVLIICTPQYKQKADARKGGVGYEESIISSDVFMTQNHRKYITVLAAGTWEAATPVWAGGKYGVNLSDHQFDGEEFEKLVNGLKR